MLYFTLCYEFFYSAQHKCRDPAHSIYTECVTCVHSTARVAMHHCRRVQHALLTVHRDIGAAASAAAGAAMCKHIGSAAVAAAPSRSVSGAIYMNGVLVRAADTSGDWVSSQ
jgi:hypothetical protein